MRCCTIQWQFSTEADSDYATFLGCAGPLGTSEELKLRLRPLREQWEARGPGLLLALQRQLPWLCFPEQALINLVRPVRGGGCLLRGQRMYFEAVLANAHQQLPEVLRLGWLITTNAAHGSLPQAHDHWRRLATALVPYVLRAGEQVELTTCDLETLGSCLQLWQLLDAVESDFAAELLKWSQSRPAETSAEWWSSTLEVPES